jgi:hypothetical protein
MGKIPMDLDILILDASARLSAARAWTPGSEPRRSRAVIPGDAPIIERIFIRDLNNMSYGNGVGLGMADVISDGC